MKELNNKLFDNYKELRGRKDKVCFIQSHFWDKAKIKGDLVDYTGLLQFDDLIVKIFEDSVNKDDLIIMIEANLVCIAISTLNYEKSQKIIAKYNAVLKNKPHYKKEFIIS